MASKRRSTPLVVEAIEPRILYSADAPALLGADTGLPGQDSGSAPAYVSASATAIQTQSLASSGDTQNQSSQRHEVVLIDGSVPDADALATQLAAGSDGTRLLDVYVIDPAKDGVAQINDILAQYHGNVDAIHLISHGSDGAVQIGNTELNGNTLLGNAVAISNWGNALTADGDILLYGCDVAADQSGRDFVDALGQLTGADVMASSDLTGAGAQGGNWTLEYSQGHIETGLALNAAQQAAFNGVLATYYVDSTADTNTNTDATHGTLRWAINQANSNAGADTILFAISGTGVKTINVGSSGLGALPTITGQLTIDGTTQAGYNASTPTPMIELNGASAGSGSDGLFLTSAASGSTIKGLIINNFGGSGIELNGAISNITILGNYIGTNSAGTVAAGNGAYGIYVDTSASNLTIGGTTADARNVISSNKGAGIFVQNGSNTVILGNHIGVNAMGDGPLGNTSLNATDTGYGIKVVNSTGTVIGNASGGRNVISGNASGGIFITGGSSTSIAGNYIGTTADGASGIGNGTDGIKLNNTATGNTVTGNLVSGNGQYGVYVVNASNAVIQGNKIGTNLAGNAVLPNMGSAGIQVNNSGATIGGTGNGQGNLISGNVGDGIGIVNGSTSVTVQGNYIGTDAAGNVALKNGGSGIYLNNIAGGVTIGGSVAGARNIISGNGNRGIFADDATFTVSGNYIGVNASGAALGNTNIGIYLTNGSNDVTIGSAGAGNVIAANGSDGIRIDGSTDITIQGNTIGSTTSAALGNKRQGIYLYTDSTNVLIGGSGAGEGNVIAYNGINGIATAWNPIYGNSFLGNAIYGNGSLASGVDATGNYGIDLGTDGVTSNDADDVDTGPNDLQNTPVLTSATAAGGNTTVNFTLNSSPSTTYRIEFFANDVNGREGKVYLGYVDVTTNSAGNVTSSKVFSGSYAGKWITATATDTSSTETSEFSATAAVANAVPVITSNGGTATASTSVAENTTAVTTVTATDANGDTLTFSITGGADASKFTIDANTGALQFLAAPNYESPTDTGGDNVYVVTVSVSDGRGGVKAQTLNVTVTNVGTVVTNTNDSGNGSLRQAIIESNQQAGVDTISFAIPGTGVQTIVLQTALPTITDKVILDGTTQTGWTTTSGPLIELNGAAAAGANGLFVDSGGSGSTIKGLTINRFDANGITLTGASNVTIQGNYIGINAAGTAISGGSMDSGIYVQGGSGNIIGGTAAGMGNVLSGAGYGVYLNGTNANQVQGNYIGTNAAGTAKLGNVFSGVFINGSSANNTIGGTTAAAANVIGGNNDGVELSSSGNTVQGNYIGTNANGIKIANSANGVRINGGANNNTIGGTVAGAGNVISGNTYGIIITDANGTLIQGNYIGTNSFSATGLGNALSGVFIRGSSTGNIVGGTTAAARNIISGNKDGVELPASGNTVQGNYIGINVGGTAPLANTGFGVRLDSGDGNIIGGTAAGAGNVISGNGTGVDINGATNTLVQGNYIGTDAAGTTAIKNTTAGINIRGSSTGNVIGSTSAGTDAAARNVISGNTEGVIISAASNTVAGNYIGVDKTGVVRLGNINYGIRINSGGNSNTIGGSTTAARNIISGNHDGILLAGNSNTVVGNYIGLDINGAVMANGYIGVFVNGGSNNNIGGINLGNVISGNGTEGIDIVNGAGTAVLGNFIGVKADGASAAKNGDNGIRIAGATTGTQVVGNIISGNGNNGIYLYNNATGVTIGSNHIGAGFSGTTRVANQNNGIWVDSGSSNITIGGTSTAMRNVISGNDNNGIYLASTTGVSILGNYIGIDANGTTALGNGIGIYVESGNTTTIGGTAAGAGNVISGNFSSGVYLQGANTVVLQGNYIGTDKNGTAKVGNAGDGINMLGASNVTIGGTAAGAGNIISGNGHVDGNGNKLGDGIWIDRSSGVLIQGNYIGVDMTGAVKLANAADGIGVSSSNSTASTGVTIGGTTTAARNVLSGNGGHGIWIGKASGTTVQNNYIGTNAAGTAAIANTWDGIEIGAGATNTLIGGANVGNLISGNGWSGIRIRASGVTVQGNSIGTNAAGTAAIANAEYGIVIYDNVSNIDIGGTTSGAGNLISGNTNDGINVEDTSVLHIYGNYIGTTVGGNSALGNGGQGIYIGNNSSQVYIGSSAAGARNVISGNVIDGVLIGGDSSPVTQVYVQGNYIGIGADGNTDVGNGQHGVDVYGTANGVVVGGASAGEGNVISGNGVNGITIDANGTVVKGNIIGLNAAATAIVANGNSGIKLGPNATNTTIGAAGQGNTIAGSGAYGIETEDSSSTTIQGNTIGTNAGGATGLGNTKAGIFIGAGTTGTLVGGTNAGDGNIIAQNGGKGITLEASTSTSGNRFLGNAIYANNGIGIDLGGNGVTANDANDVDTGANALQNFPLLAAAYVTGSNTLILGSFNSTPSRTYRIEFYANDSKDASGNGEGQIYLGYIQITTDASGNASISTTLTGVTAGQWISATATDLTTNNTSEFAADVQAVNNTAPTISSGNSVTAYENSTTVSTVTGNDANGDTLSYSIIGGADAGKFSINSSTGVITFLAAPNYEAPGSAAGTNVYTVQVKVDDGKGGTVTQTLTVTVANVNEAPAGTDKTVTINEDTSYTFVATDFGFTDTSDNPANSLQAIKIGTISGGGTLTLNGVAVTNGQTITAADIAAGKLKFTPAANGNGNNYASFTFQVQDNGGTGNGGVDTDATPNTITFNVTAINDAPSGTDKTVTINEDGSYTFTATDFGFSDVDGNSLQAIKIGTISGGGSLTLNGVAVQAGDTISVAQIGNLKFTPAANTNGNAYASFTFQVQDNGGTSNGGVDTDTTPNTITFNVTAINDAPSGTDNTVTINEDGSYTFTATDFGFSDVDGNSLQAIKIGTISGGGSLTLNGVAVQAGDTISVAQIGNLKFTPAANANGNAYASFTFQVQDNGGTSNGGIDTDPTPNTFKFNVTATNDAPVVTSNGGGSTATVSVAENTTAVTTVTATDVDGDTLSFSIVGGADAGKFIIDTGTGALKFIAAPNYEAPGDGNGDNVYVVQIRVADGNGGTVTQTISVTVTDVNEAPSGADNTITMDENTSYVFKAADFGFSDVDGNGMQAVVITTLPGAGTLSLSGSVQPMVPGRVIQLSDIIAGKLKFTPAAGANGNAYASFTFQVQDNGGTSNGGVDTDQTPNTMTFNVTPANRAPSGTDQAATINEDQPYVFNTGDFGFSDPDGNTLQSVKITTIPGAGSLTLDGVAVANGQVVSAADIAAGKLVFTPAANASGNNYASFTFQVQDNGGTNNGGVDLDQSANTFTFNVTAVNDAPVITSGASASTVENSTEVMTVTATDMEGDAVTFTIAGGADAAFFTIDNTTGVLKFISAPDHEAALDADGDNVYVVTVSVSDGNGGVTAKTISVTVTDAGYVVTNTNDSGAGSLRQAIIEANQHLGLDTITFAIPGADAQTISVISALPNITDAVVIDATSQHGYANIPLIEVEGAAAGGAANGFYFASGASGSTIKGFVINRFGGAGIVLDGVFNITIQGNYIGTDNTGAFTQGNGADGIKIDNGAADIHIGGTTAATRNVISGNLGDGIKLDDASNVYIEGNYIGTDATGTQRVSNIGHGVSMGAGADNIFVGGTAGGAGNVISGNNGNGVDIDSSTNVFVQGNIIGANKSGTAALNNAWGIYVKDAAGSVIIGGTVAGARNVVSGNVNGIALDNSSGVLVQGNYVGINAAGTAALANDNTGIYVGTNGSGNVIGGTASGAGNVISGNMGAGIKIEQASGVAIQGNYIGTNATGNATVGNGTDGILVVGSSNTTIGGTTTSARNVISGNSSDGIELDSASTNNSVLGNFIGTDVSGTVDLGNGDNGIRLSGANNTIGGTAAGAGNLISGNGQNGIEVRNTSGTVIQGNTIGTDLSGMADLGNTWAGIDLANVTGATIGGTGTAKNLISGNDRDGIYAAAIANTTISGNTIGLNATGTAQLANGGAGIELSNSSNNVIGGTASGAGNVVSGNGAQGIVLHSGSASNTLQGNLIGTNAAGTAAIGNSWSGLEIDASNNNVVGGTGSGEGNLISGNQQAGVLIKGTTTGTSLSGNKVGTNLAGNAKVGNAWSGVTIADGTNNTIDSNLVSGNVGDGIELAGNATNNTVRNNIIGLDATGKTALGNWDGIAVSGSSNTIDGNTVSGNAQTGIVLNGGTGNTLTDNIIGLDITGKTVVANGSAGIRIANGASANIIGGSGAANTIAGNLNYGIVIDGASGNIVQGNTIGTNATGDTGLGNGLGGINFDNAATGNLIGGTNAGEGNVIANNTGNGITALNVAGVTGNRFLGNTIYGNSAMGIDLGNDGVTGNDSGDVDTGANGMQNFPLLAGAYVMGSNTLILGSFNSTPSRTYRIEFYANDSKDASGNGEGQIYLGYIQITTDASGNASISTTLTGVTAGQWISATATDLTTNNTSEFAADVQAVNNTAPTISSGNSVTAYENSTTVSTVTGNDANGDTLSYSIIGGADAGKFSINSSTGVITFLAAPNYEAPGSAAGTNVYTVQVKVDDGKGGTVTQTLTVTVANVNEAPAGTDKTVTINEDTSYTFVATDFGFTDTSDNPANSLQAIKIGTISGGGTLTLNGVAVTNGQTITAADITAGKLKFTPAANANGNNYASFSFQVQDNGGTGNGGVDIDPTPNTITFNVTSINDAPSGADKLVTIDEDGSYTFTATDFGFSDIDGNSLQAIKIGTISGGGTLTLNGVAVQAGDTIAVAQIGNLKFTPAANANGNNYASFSFQVQDNGGTSNGGVDTDATPNTITFNVTSINDAPSGADNTVTINEDGSHTFTATDFGFNDIDGNSLQAIKIGTISGGGTLTLNGVAVQAGDTITVAQIGNLKFTPAANANGNNYASFTFQVQDNGGTSNGGVDTDATSNTISFNVTSINDAPSGTDNTVTIDEDGSYTFGLSDFVFSDVDGNALDGVKITSIPSAGTLTLNGVAVTNGQTISAADIAAGKLVFSPAANANGNNYASFTFQVQDNGGTSNGGIDTDPTPNTFTFNVTSINDAPSGADNTVTIDEDGSHTFTPTDFGFNDIDGNSLQAIKIGTISGGGTLTLNGVAVQAGDTITVAQIGNLKFTPAANANGNAYASFTFQVQDNGGTSNGGVDTDQSANTFTFNVTSVNDAPSGTDKTVTIDEDGSYTFTGTDFGFNDVDGNSLQGVKITTIPGAGTLMLDGVAVTAGQTISVADINSGKLKFSPAANANGNNYASFTFQVQDNGGTSNGGIDTDPMPNTFTFNVTSINDAPSGTDKAVTIDEDGSYTFTGTDFGFTDIDGNSLQGVKITTIPGAGTLTLDGVAVTAGQTISVTDINSGKLKFSPAANANGNNYASFSFQVQDNGGASDGGVDIDQSANTFTFNVTSINDAPSGTDKTVTINEDGSYTFTPSDFGFNDIDGNSLQAIKIGTISGGGTLTLNGVAVQAGDTIAVAQIGNLKFTPAANANGNGYASFTFQVQDNGGTSNGGVDTDQSANTFTINVTPVNDAPVITSNGGGSTASVTTPENATSVTTVVGSDVENDTLTYSIIGGADSAKFSIDASTGLLTFITAPDFETPTDADLDNVYVVTVQVSDGNGGTVTQTISVTLADANEAPVITSDGGGSTAAVPVYENGTTVTTVAASDVDHDTLTYSISGGADGGKFSIDASTGALHFIAAPNFELPADADGDNVYQVQVTVADGNGGIATQTINVTVRNVNEAPTGADKTVTTNEDIGYVLKLEDFGFADVDNASNLNAVRITAIPTAGTLTLNGVAVQLNDVITAGDIAAGKLVFTPAANANGTNYAGFSFRVQDDGGTANGGVDWSAASNTITIDVTSVNDAPSGTDKTVMTNEDTPYVFKLSDFGFADANDAAPPNALLAVKIASLPVNGVLMLGTTAVSAGQFVSAADIAAGKLVFVPAANANGNNYAGFTFQVQDNGGTANGGVDLSAVRNMRIDVASVNDAPSASDNAVTTQQGSPYVFRPADFGFSDVDGNSLLAVKIGTLPAAGRLTLDGVAVSAGQTIAAADIAAGKLRFVPAVGASAAGRVSFSFQVQDDGGTARGGSDVSAANTMTVNLTALPELGNPTPPVAPGKEPDVPAQSGGNQGGTTRPVVQPVTGFDLEPIRSIAPPPATAFDFRPGTARISTQSDVVSASASRDGVGIATPQSATLSLGSYSLLQQAYRNGFAQMGNGEGGALANGEGYAGSRTPMGDIKTTTGDMPPQTIEIATAVTTLGTVWMVARRGALAASMLASVPAWVRLDPLPVLGMLNGEKEKSDDDIDMADHIFSEAKETAELQEEERA